MEGLKKWAGECLCTAAFALFMQCIYRIDVVLSSAGWALTGKAAIRRHSSLSSWNLTRPSIFIPFLYIIWPGQSLDASVFANEHKLSKLPCLHTARVPHLRHSLLSDNRQADCCQLKPIANGHAYKETCLSCVCVCVSMRMVSVRVKKKKWWLVNNQSVCVCYQYRPNHYHNLLALTMVEIFAIDHH